MIRGVLFAITFLIFVSSCSEDEHGYLLFYFVSEKILPPVKVYIDNDSVGVLYQVVIFEGDHPDEDADGWNIINKKRTWKLSVKGDISYKSNHWCIF